MNKIEYLNALKEALKYVDITVMEEIVSDYEEHFQVGMENGKSEEQICRELGLINDLVKEINEVYNTGDKNRQDYTDEKLDSKHDYSTNERSSGKPEQQTNRNQNGKQEHSIDYKSDSKQSYSTYGRAYSKPEHSTNEDSGSKQEEPTNGTQNGKQDHSTDEKADSKQAYSAHERSDGRQEHSANEKYDNRHFNYDADEFSSTINRAFDSASDAINQALNAASEAISKVDVKDIGNRLKNSMEHAASRFSNFADNHYRRDPDSFNNSTMNTETYQDNITKSFDIYDPSNRKINIVVDGLCADIYVKESTDGKINISYENNGNDRHKQKYAFYSYMEGNTVYAGVRNVGNAVFLFDFKAYAINIHLEIPENIGVVDIKTASGDIRVLNVRPESIFTETASGDISYNRVDARDLQLKSSSGDISMVDGSGVQIKAGTLSGDIEAKNIDAKTLSLKSTSGDLDAGNTKADTIDYSSLSGSLDIVRLRSYESKIKSTSGDVEINDSTMDNADISSISGDIQLSNDAGESLSVKNTSGDVELDVNVRRCWASSKSGDVEVSLNGDAVLESSSTSGDINISLKNFGNGYSVKSRTVSGSLYIHYNDHHQRNLKTGTYTYGNQGSELILSSTSGNIQVSD